jgi:hypothetical protein
MDPTASFSRAAPGQVRTGCDCQAAAGAALCDPVLAFIGSALCVEDAALSVPAAAATVGERIADAGNGADLGTAAAAMPLSTLVEGTFVMIEPQHWKPRPPMPPVPPLPPFDPNNPTFAQLNDLIQMQQRTISFLIGEYNDLLDMITKEGEEFGELTTFAVGDTIPVGWWQPVTPPTGVVAQSNIHGTTVDHEAPNMFWSDGNTEAHTNASTMVRVAQKPGS